MRTKTKTQLRLDLDYEYYGGRSFREIASDFDDCIHHGDISRIFTRGVFPKSAKKQLALGLSHVNVSEMDIDIPAENFRECACGCGKVFLVNFAHNKKWAHPSHRRKK